MTARHAMLLSVFAVLLCIVNGCQCGGQTPSSSPPAMSTEGTGPIITPAMEQFNANLTLTTAGIAAE